MLLQCILKKELEITITVLITSQFSYCPLVWMCNCRTRNKKKLHERAIRLAYNDRRSTFEKLLDKDKSFSVHPQNLQVLASDMYKVHSNVPPDITK